MGWRPALDRQGARVVRLAGFGLLAIAASIAAVTLLLPFAARLFVRAIELTMNACVWAARSLSVGMSLWSMTRVIVRNAAGLMASGQATAALAVLVLIGALAAYGLQRLLGSEEESS
jgi:hypothetical protein